MEIKARAMAMIQNRTMILGSGQPLSSKWWCRGAILKIRPPLVILKKLTWKMTDRASMTNSPPTSTNSISCNASNQDVVSMGTVAARKAFKLVSNAKHILTMEVLADMQALSFRNADRLGLGTSRIYALLKKDFQVYDNSTIFHDSLVKFRKLLFSSQLFDDLGVYFKPDSP